MNLGTHWEREKNAALLELDRRNRTLESKLLESNKIEADAVSSQLEDMQEGMLHAIHEAFERQSFKKNTNYMSQNSSILLQAFETQGVTSPWERQKNAALLELEKRNQQLLSLLKSKEQREVENEQEKELIEEGFIRGQEYMRLFAQVRAIQSSAVHLTQRIWLSRRMNAVFSCWARFVKNSRKKKILCKGESVWERRILSKSFAVFTARQARASITKKLTTIADKHRKKAHFLHSFRCWVCCIQSRKSLRERMAVFKVVKRTHTKRVAFTAWRIFLVTTAVKLMINLRAEKLLAKHRIRKSWEKWGSSMYTSRVYNYEASEFSKRRILTYTLQTWHRNIQESILELAYNARIEQHRKRILLQKCVQAWRRSVLLQVIMQRRLDKLISTRIRRILVFTFLGWKQYVKNKKEVKAWRSMSLTRQRFHSKREAFNVWKDKCIQHRLFSRFKSQQVARIRLAVLKAWSHTLRMQRACLAHVCNMLKRAQQRWIKDLFNRWLAFLAESRRLYIVKEARITQARLELSHEDLQAVGRSQAEMIKIIKLLEKENLTMVKTINRVTARTPTWTSGFLDAELRWGFPRSTKGSVPSARVGHTAVALHTNLGLPSYIVVIGGYNGESLLHDILVFHSVDSTWRTPEITYTESSFARGIQHHTACAQGNRIIIFGGFDGTNDSSDLSIIKLSENGVSCVWSRVEHRVGILPGPMSQHTSCLTDDGKRMYVFGGYRTKVGHLRELWILDTQYMDWHLPEYYGDIPSARRGHGAAIVRAKMYVFGGYDGHSNLNDLHVFDLETMHWELVNSSGEAPSSRRHHSMEAVGRHILVYGGYNGVLYLEDVYTFDTVTYTWKKWNILKPGGDKLVYGRSMHAMVLTGQRFVMLGGIHEYGPLGDILYLENGAAIDGLELQRELTEERSEVQTLRNAVVQYEKTLQRRTQDLALAYSRITDCQTALKEEAKQRKTAVSKQQVLIHKLKKARKKANLVV